MTPPPSDCVKEKKRKSEVELANRKTNQTKTDQRVNGLDETLARALATADAQAATLRRDLDQALADSDKKEKELGRLRHHLLDMEDEDDDKADAAESRMAAIRREQEEEHKAAMEAKDAAARGAERELEVMREAMAARDAELANLQLALEFFNNEVESGERRAAETVALREKNATMGAELVAGVYVYMTVYSPSPSPPPGQNSALPRSKVRPPQLDVGFKPPLTPKCLTAYKLPRAYGRVDQ